MKVAFLNIYNGIVERGAEVFVDEVASNLSKSLEVSVFQAGKTKNKYYNTVQISGIRYTQTLYHFWVLIFTLKCLPYLWREKYDWIVPVNGRFQSLICRFFRFLRRGKILISGHAGVGYDDKLNIILGKPDVFIALTQNAYIWAKKISHGNTLIFYIPNGVNLKQFKPEIKKAEIDLKNPIVLCTSALLPYKRIDLLIKACVELKDSSLLVIGDGPLYNELGKLGKNSLGKRFKIIKSVSHSEMGSYYNAAKVFSLPSRGSEAFGLVYLEAMACGVPVVAPNDKNREEIIGEGGILCDVENIGEYTKALGKALKTDFDNKPRRQADKFSWEQIAREYFKIFDMETSKIYR